MVVDPSAVDVVQRFYKAVADRDLAAAADCFDVDAIWILPSRSAIAGEHRGWDAIRDNVLTKVGPLSGGTFTAELTEVAIGDQHLVAVQHATATHRGKRLDITGCQLMSVENGKIVEIRGPLGPVRTGRLLVLRPRARKSGPRNSLELPG